MISPRFLIRLCAALLLFSCTFALPAAAQKPVESHLAALQTDLQEQQTALESFDTLLAQEGLTNKKLNKARDDLRLLRDHFQSVADEIRPLYETALADISDLGEAPAVLEGMTPIPEPEGIRELRMQLTEKTHALEATLKLAEASNAKTLRSLERITILRRSMFVDQLLERQTLPFDLALWKTGHAAMHELQGKLGTLLHNAIWQQKHMKIALLIAALLIGGSALSMRHFLRVKLALHQNDSIYTPFTLASFATIVSFLDMLAALFIVFQALSVVPDLDQTALDFAKRFLLITALAIFLTTASRNLAIAGNIRRTMKYLLILSGLLYGADAILMEYGRITGAPIEMIVAHSYVFTTIFAVFLLFFSSLTLRSKSGRARFFLPKKLFYLFPFAGLFILTANIFGYVSLTRYISTQMGLVGFFLTFMLMLRGSIRPSLYQLDAFVHRGFADDKADEGQTTDAVPEEKDEKLVFFWASLTLDLFLLLLSIPVIASMFGTEWLEIKEWGIKAFYGVQIGGMTISIAKISLAIVVFFMLLFLTRSLQRIFGQRILPKTKIEDSVRSSLVQILGYGGTIIALFAGLSAFGFNLTNLALIAGALSVGIGFGLQSIVNNFVSGLILLFERPIKIGDWVVVSSGEGIVKSINVRSTEIETFDRTSIIVPNSELISSSVKNWTHSDKTGRVVISVGVSYGSDPKTVHDILMACAEKNPHMLKTPAPTVVFKDFGDSALIFDLRFFIRNIGDVFKAQTQARFDIWYALKDNNIEIPFPQRDLHIRSDATKPAPRKTAAKKKKA